jgi:hypothetical protein
VNSRSQEMSRDWLFTRIACCDYIDRCLLLATGSLQGPARLPGGLENNHGIITSV